VTTAGMEIVDLYYMTTVADAGRLASSLPSCKTRLRDVDGTPRVSLG
jgi:hypothetical protein